MPTIENAPFDTGELESVRTLIAQHNWSGSAVLAECTVNNLLHLFGALYQEVSHLLLSPNDALAPWQKTACINHVLNALSDPAAALEQRRHLHD